MQLKALLVLAVALTCFVAAASAQEITGTISGTVTDPSGAAVPEAKVSVTSQQTSIQGTTSAHGK